MIFIRYGFGPRFKIKHISLSFPLLFWPALFKNKNHNMYILNNSLIWLYIILASHTPPAYPHTDMAASINKQQSSTTFTLDSCGWVEGNFLGDSYWDSALRGLTNKDAQTVQKRHPEKALCQNLVVGRFKINKLLKQIFLGQFYGNDLRAAQYKSSSTASNVCVVTLFLI